MLLNTNILSSSLARRKLASITFNSMPFGISSVWLRFFFLLCFLFVALKLDWHHYYMYWYRHWKSIKMEFHQNKQVHDRKKNWEQRNYLKCNFFSLFISAVILSMPFVAISFQILHLFWWLSIQVGFLSSRVFFLQFSFLIFTKCWKYYTNKVWFISKKCAQNAKWKSNQDE